MATNMSLHPEPPSSEDYLLWRKDIHVWKKITTTPKAKMGLALQYACRVNKKIHEAVLNITEAEVECEDGLENVLKVLDGLHHVDQRESAVQCYEEFERLKRREDQKIADFIIQFESMHNKTKKHGNTLSDDLLASKLMRAINLSAIDQRKIRACTSTFTFQEIKKVLKRTYGDSTYTSIQIKPEAVVGNCKCKEDETEGHQHKDKSNLGIEDENTFNVYSSWRKQ